MSPHARKLASSGLEVDCVLSIAALADLIDRAVDRVHDDAENHTGHGYRAAPIASSANDINFALNDLRTGRRVMAFRFLLKPQSGRVLLSSSISDYRTGATSPLGGKRLLGYDNYIAIISDIARAIIAADPTARAYLDDGTHTTALSNQHGSTAAGALVSDSSSNSGSPTNARTTPNTLSYGGATNAPNSGGLAPARLLPPAPAANGSAPTVPGHFPGAVTFEPVPPGTGSGAPAPTGYLSPPKSGALITAIPGRSAPISQGPPTPSVPQSPSTAPNWLGSVVHLPEGSITESNTTVSPETILARRPGVGAATGITETEWYIELAEGRQCDFVGTALLGRDPSSDDPGAQLIPLNDQSRTVSKTHARIQVDGNDAIITDLGSTNGTSLGSSQPLTAGQAVRVTGTTEVSLGKYELRLVRRNTTAK